jgi:hypothetical protein
VLKWRTHVRNDGTPPLGARDGVVVVSRLRSIFACVLAAAVWCPVSVAGAAWPLEGPAQELLGYGASYERAGVETVHHGVDLACDVGAAVLAPAAGLVTFAGAIPGEGGRVLAVTVSTGEGTLVTCMPLEELGVATGQTIQCGDVLGSASASGDPSSIASHVHVSVRRGTAYLDPANTIGAPPASGPSAPEVSAIEGECAPSTDDGAPAAQGVAVLEQSEPVVQAGTAAVPVPVQTREPAEGGLGASPVLESGMAVEKETPAPAMESRVAPSAAEGGTQDAASVAAGTGAAVASRTGRCARAHLPSPTGVHAPGVPTNRSGAFARFAPGVCAVLVAALGLWPLWRRQPQAAVSSGVRPILDDVAAAVGR